jgi:hypothetical protein
MSSYKKRFWTNSCGSRFQFLHFLLPIERRCVAQL